MEDSMTRTQKILFIAIVILQLGVLSFMMGKRMILLSEGKKILIV